MALTNCEGNNVYKGGAATARAPNLIILMYLNLLASLNNAISNTDGLVIAESCPLASHPSRNNMA